MPLLISDANIIIDLIDGEILPLMFELDYDFATSDILYDEELGDCEHDLLGLGLILLEVSGDFMIEASAIKARHGNKPSMNDYIVLALAMQELSPLLTGDRPLREIAIQHGIEVKGTLWLVQQMYEQGIMTKMEVEVSFEKMKAAGSWLPWDKVGQLIASMR